VITSEERARLVQGALESISAGSKSFRFASQLFDLPTRERSWLLYSWCRACDDITDGQTLGHDAERVADPSDRIAFLKNRTAAAFAGEDTGLVPFDALRVVAADCAIPPAIAADHLAGFERDAAGWRPVTTEDLLSYCYQVAGAVGVMMAHVMGVSETDTDTLDRAADLGIAFQLANIARDVVEDARVGRVYLPAEWLEAEGLAGADLADPKHGRRLPPLRPHRRRPPFVSQPLGSAVGKRHLRRDRHPRRRAWSPCMGRADQYVQGRKGRAGDGGLLGGAVAGEGGPARWSLDPAGGATSVIPGLTRDPPAFLR
jgi:phytoene/squalene synthetase